MYQYEAFVLNVVDGDTVDLKVSLGLRQYTEDRFRLHGIDAWETRGEHKVLGRRSRAALIDLILDKTVIIDTLQDRRGKYGRYICTIWHQGDNVNQWLVDNGHAVVKEY